MKKLIILLVLGALSLTSCLKSGSGSSVQGIENGVTISGNLGVSSSKILGFVSTLDSYNINCTTIEETPRLVKDSLNSSGSFSVTLPRGVPFSCAFEDTVENRSFPLVVTTGDSGFSSGTTDTLDLNSGLEMGDIPLDLTTGRAEVDPAIVASATNPIESSLSIDSFHNTSWKMSCLNDADTECASFIADNEQGGEQATVFFRVLAAQDSISNTLNGFAVWKNQSSFNSCGAIDFTTATAADIAVDEALSWTQISTGASFIEDLSLCPLSNGVEWEKDTIENYLAAGPVNKNGSAFSFIDESIDNDGSCLNSFTTNVSFTAASSSVLIGRFSQTEIVLDQTPNGCGSDNKSEVRNFLVKFSKI